MTCLSVTLRLPQWHSSETTLLCQVFSLCKLPPAPRALWSTARRAGVQRFLGEPERKSTERLWWRERPGSKPLSRHSRWSHCSPRRPSFWEHASTPGCFEPNSLPLHRRSKHVDTCLGDADGTPGSWRWPSPPDHHSHLESEPLATRCPSLSPSFSLSLSVAMPFKQVNLFKKKENWGITHNGNTMWAQSIFKIGDIQHLEPLKWPVGGLISIFENKLKYF